MTPNPYIPRPWQLPHLIATPVGGTVLIVQGFDLFEPGDGPHELSYIGSRVYSRISQHKAEALDAHHISRPADDGYVLCPIVKGGGKGEPVVCPLGPVGTVLAIKRRWIAGCIDSGIPKDIVCEGDPRFGLYEGGFKINPKRTCPKEAWLLFRTTAIDLRRVDTMTAREANRWGVTAVLDRDGTDADRLIAVVTEQEAAKERYLADNPGATWGDWAWFITAERAERA